MRFLIDMPLAPRLVNWLADRGHEAVHASHLGLASAPDVEIIASAAAEQRVIVTADLDYPRLLALSRASGPGIILFRGGAMSEAQIDERLAAVLRSIPMRDLGASIVVVQAHRIRRRRLPIE